MIHCTNQKRIKRGDIYYIRDNRKSAGSEQRAGRPAVIVSNDMNNTFSEVYEIVYLTTQPKPALPTHFVTTSTPKPSTALCEQIHSVCQSRIGKWIGALNPDETREMDRCLAVSVGIQMDKPAVEADMQQEAGEITAAQQRKARKL